MKVRLLVCLAAILALSGCEDPSLNPPAARVKIPTRPVAPERKIRTAAVTLSASDGVHVFGDFYGSDAKAPTIILLFHQAGSNAGEYAEIGPRLAREGYDALAIDQRSGGDIWGRTNRTAAHLHPQPPPHLQTKMRRGLNGDYLSAYKDLEGALSWARAKKYENIGAWGSSYSASLVLKLAAEHTEIKAVLAFSPGEYFANKTLAHDWNMKEDVPTLMAFTPDEVTSGGLSLYQASSHSALRNGGDMILSFEPGVHGSSTLREDKNPVGAKRYWAGVLAFLKARAH